MEKNFKELEDIFEEYVNRFLNKAFLYFLMYTAFSL